MRYSETIGGVIAGVMFLGLAVMPEALAQAADSPTKTLRVVRAQRAEHYGLGSGVKPKEASDVVLVVEFEGPSEDEWFGIKNEDAYVMAGERRCEVVMKVSSESIFDRTGKKISDLHNTKGAFIVPRSLRKLTLHVVGYAPAAFIAEQTIEPKL